MVCKQYGRAVICKNSLLCDNRSWKDRDYKRNLSDFKGKWTECADGRAEVGGKNGGIYIGFTIEFTVISKTETSMSISMYWIRGTFELVLRVLQIMQDGVDALKEAIFSLFSWTDFVTGGGVDDSLIGKY